jgi:formylglycine-generating enzyme required for sulfatase activity
LTLLPSSLDQYARAEAQPGARVLQWPPMPPHAQAFGPLSTTRYTASGVAFDMVRVPPGCFVDGEGAEKRMLFVTRPFQIGLTLVTQALWRAVTGKSPSKFRGDDRPVEQVSWDDAQAFLGQLESLGLSSFRLPTEAEWAWAVRCGVVTRWAGADRVEPVAVTDRQSTAPVGGLLPSAAGVLDLSGNVWEWQRDVWLDSPAAGVDVQGPASGSYRVLRGGSWGSVPRSARVAVRSGFAPGLRGNYLGVRLLRATP